jgi:ribA/ribD-fused uncharacterized protein
MLTIVFGVIKDSSKMKPEVARSKEALILSVEAGHTPKYVFFWGHTPKIPGKVDQSCLSNWFASEFTVEGVRYPTMEHYMMAEKAHLFGDQAILPKILAADSPALAKKLGREVNGFDDAVWKKHRFEIVVDGTTAKFEQNPALRELLAHTGSKVLVEASPRDQIWGIGLGRDNERSQDPRQWRGLNLLGFALMETRARLTATT